MMKMVGIVREWNGLGDALMITSEIEGSSEGVCQGELASAVETMEADNIQTEEGVSDGGADGYSRLWDVMRLLLKEQIISIPFLCLALPSL